MTILALAQEQLISFVLVDANGDEVTGLGDAFTVQISENGAAFAAGAGVKAELGLGWYTYKLTAGETDTAGTLAVLVTAAGAAQQNLLYQVSGAVWTAPSGDNILTATEAANVLRTTVDDPNMLALLPAVDAHIQMATGRNWAADDTIREEAKNAARMLLVRWHSDPGGMAAGDVPGYGLKAALTQLEAVALDYKIFAGRSGAGPICVTGVYRGESVASLVGKVGVSGDRSADFEAVITVDGEIQQTSTDDLSENWYEAHLLAPEEL